MADNKYCLILAGGNGSRLWPISRTTKPKQFLDLFGTGRTLLQQTYDRVVQFIDPSHIYVSTNVDYLPLVYEQLPEVDDMHILEEPLRRGTLAAVAWGSVFIAKQDPQSVLFVTPSDQIILREEQYKQDVLAGLQFVGENEGLLVMGITPSRPETGYGYIQIDDEKSLSNDIFPVKSFTEKPDAEFANIFMQEGNFLWNTGLLCFNTRSMLDNLFMLVPEYRVEIPRMMAEAESNNPKLLPEFFSVLPNYNMDVSILERTSQVYVQRGHFGWADIGTWASIGKDVPSDADGNVMLDTDAYLYECSDNVIRLPKGHTAVVKGLHDYVIAEEGEFLMICPRQDIAAMRRMHTDTKFGDPKS
ncbi:MAG: mannose-1-phosphate guanylyltransferase [Bacteroidaceae bacterium]|nr:mannose-1-phosphate guanylyltransferase [Bacteroidaceae bacterium]